MLGVGPCSVMEVLLRHPKKWKSEAIRQILVSKAMEEKGYFANDIDDDMVHVSN
jgi:hypothetical protein